MRSAFAIASCCCSPPDRVPAALPRRVRSWGNRSSSRSIRGVELVTDREAAELEVLADGEVCEHRPTPHHERDALSAADLRR